MTVAHTEIFNILSRWTGEIQASVEIECKPDDFPSVKLGLAVRVAHKSGANLVEANLVGANLVGANLDGARLVGARLDGARLDGASLDGARLDGARLDGASLDGASLVGARLDRGRLVEANLVEANLVGANLVGANLDGASLDGASLDGASLDGASLVGANLDGASLDGARLDEGVLRPFKADLWLTLHTADPAEVLFLAEQLRVGEVDGSTYGDGNRCACLIGTIARARGVAADSLDYDAGRPAEQWFMMIRPGDLPTHETGGGFAARKALEWTLEYVALRGIAAIPAPAEVA